jgi:hypothetical protein
MVSSVRVVCKIKKKELINCLFTCRLIINDSLDTGSQLPYIREAKELGYNVLVLNTNDNQGVSSDGSKQKIRVCYKN